MKKRILSLLLATIMVVSVCACGNGAEESEAVSTETRVAVENYVPTYPIVEEPITIKGLVVGMDTSVSSTRKVWDEVEAITNIHIEWENIDLDAYSTRLASGQWPDIIAHDMGQTALYDYAVLGGRMVNYLDYLDIMPNLKQVFEEYPAALAYATQLDGGVYNLFRVSGVQATACSARPHYLKHVLAEAGWEGDVATVDDFYNALKMCKEYYGTPSYIHYANKGSGWCPMLFAAFGTLTQMDMADDGTGKIVPGRTTDQYKEYLKFMHKLYDEELMHREYLTLVSSAQLKLAQSGTYAFIPAGNAQNLVLEDLDGDWNNLGTLKPFTSEFDSTQEIIGYPDYNTTAGMYINKDSEYVEEICKMLDIAFAKEEVVPGSNLYGINFTSGPEHIVWENNGDGTFEELTPEGYSSRLTYNAQVYIWEGFGRNDAWANLVTSTPGNTQVRQMAYLENVIPYQSERYVNMKAMKFTEDEQYIIENRWGEINTYVNQMEAEFISGSKDIDAEWDGFVAQLNQMGLQDCVEVYQAAYDRFNAAMAAINAE